MTSASRLAHRLTHSNDTAAALGHRPFQGVRPNKTDERASTRPLLLLAACMAMLLLMAGLALQGQTAYADDRPATPVTSNGQTRIAYRIYIDGEEVANESDLVVAADAQQVQVNVLAPADAQRRHLVVDRVIRGGRRASLNQYSYNASTGMLISYESPDAGDLFIEMHSDNSTDDNPVALLASTASSAADGAFTALSVLLTEESIGETASFSIGSSIYYAGHQTSWFTVDGKNAYCASPSRSTPDAGSYRKSELVPVDASRAQEAKADLWFSYGAPGFDASMWPSTWYDGTAMTPARYAALAHVLIADTYNSDFDTAVYGCTESFDNWVRTYVIGIDASGATFNNMATGRLIYQRRYEIGSGFSPFQLNTGSSSQVIVSYESYGSIAIEKIDASSSAALDGARFRFWTADGSYDWQENTGEGNNEGHTGRIDTKYDLPDGTVFSVQEISAPTGYKIDPNIYTVTVQGCASTLLNGKPIEDKPITCSVHFIVDGEEVKKARADNVAFGTLLTPSCSLCKNATALGKREGTASLSAWHTDAACEPTSVLTTITTAAKDVYLYATSQCTVSYYADDVYICSETVPYGSTTVKSGAESGCVYENTDRWYGWFSDSACTVNYAETTPIRSNLKLYSYNVCSVRYYADGRLVLTTQELRRNKAYSIEDPVAIGARRASCSQFAGWFLNANYMGGALEGGTQMVIRENTSFYGLNRARITYAASNPSLAYFENSLYPLYSDSALTRPLEVSALLPEDTYCTYGSTASLAAGNSAFYQDGTVREVACLTGAYLNADEAGERVSSFTATGDTTVYLSWVASPYDSIESGW